MRLFKVFSVCIVSAVVVTGPALAVKKTFQFNDSVSAQASSAIERQTLPLTVRQQPGPEQIHFTDDAGIDPIITGPVHLLER